MLIQTLIEHPSSVVHIVARTPLWVGGLLLALLALGYSQSKTRLVHPLRTLLMPLAMLALSLSSMLSAFGATRWLPLVLLTWLVCAGGVVALIGERARSWEDRWDTASGKLHIAGSWTPMCIIATIFLIRYGVNVEMAMNPKMAQSGSALLWIGMLYGLTMGLGVARWRSLWALRPAKMNAITSA